MRKSLKIQKTNTTGDYNYQQLVDVEKGKTYTLSGYIKANKKRHKINGIITLLMGILFFYSIGGVENIVILVGFLAFIFNFLIFNSNTGEYLKDRN